MKPLPSRHCALSLFASVYLAATPAHADQFKETADGGTIDCAVSARELTRFALVGDQFASVSKVSSGFPYNDFAVTNEPVRGDIYISVPETFAGSRISFFATTKAGFVYKFACTIQKIDAAQVFVTNPALAKSEAKAWETRSTVQTSALQLIEAMAAAKTIDGFEVHQPASPPVRVGSLEVRLISEHRGATLIGKEVRITNRGPAPVTVTEHDLAPAGTLAVSIATPTLKSGESTSAYLVGLAGEGSHD